MTDKAKKLGNQPASPEIFFRENRAASEECPFEARSGLTKREYFAAMAMQGLLACPDARRLREIIKASIEYADMLLEELTEE